MLRDRLNTYTRIQQFRSYGPSLTYFIILVNNTEKITEISCPENSTRHQDTPEVIITATVKATQGGAAANKVTERQTAANKVTERQAAVNKVTERQKFDVSRQIKGNWNSKWFQLSRV